MTEKLKKPPVTYALMQVRISQVLDIKEYITKIQGSIRREFPLYNELNFHSLELKSGDKQPEFQNYMQWHFGNKESTTGIILSRDAIVIHTSKYNSFESLCKTFKEILDVLKSTLDISLFTRVGIRYINFLHENITKYVDPHLQGFHLSNKQGFTSNYFSRTESIQQTQCGGIINIRSSHFSDKNSFTTPQSIKNIFVTPELWQGADQLTFDHHKNMLPNNDFLILDLDHFINKQSDFDSNSILDELNILHNDIYTAFRNAITKEAIHDWS